MKIWEKIRKGLEKTRSEFLSRLEIALRGGRIDESLFEEIEEALILSDCGLETTKEIVRSLKERWKKKGIRNSEEIRKALEEEIEKILSSVQKPLLIEEKRPFVILTLGVNGVGKTTTIAKLALHFLKEGKKVMFGACDTFRACASEQLEIFARRLDVGIVKHLEGSDPAAVAFDALRASRARGIDVLILDSAGRLHTKINLMEEMKKIKRILSREEGGPHETLLVLDATNGQNAFVQAKSFHEALEVTGLVISKLDGTAKAGFILPIAKELRIPIRFLGIGEDLEDLVSFESKSFSKALLSRNGE